ncbi:Tetratricopeptide repeat-containing domain [Arabidopsis thaliana x Arabidopsis arenosa]|uniref:Tetratricopeptide repeat-containing domain n=1 Tax=Arabidopsis thaliana x Arabidopsis arenosa TaxID=1240361 RepID=A0A8T2BQ65_9BRAS|nr:Tetratricopeptide repeat-containing domain [Arabidopsis thaliana x Arabidopsis arenosa]
MAVWRTCLRASSSSSRHRFSTLFPLFFSSISNPPPLFSPSPSPSPSCFPPLRRFISSSPEFPIISQEITIPNDDSSLPVLVIVDFLDGFHEFTGLPWWMIIASSTVAVRLALLPLLILQLKKLKTISELLPKLPMPIPETPTLKGSIDQFSHFLKESRAIGCPSFLWFFPYLSVQLPCFFLLMASIRKMSLDGHPGFDSGGALWFQNLSDLPVGSFGPVFPILIAAFHYINIQISFDTSTIRQTTGLTGLLMRYYKLYLEILSVPLFFVGYAIPQGSLVYWVTNSSVNIFQQLSLKHPTVGAKLGLLSQGASPSVEHSMEISESVIKYVDSDLKEHTLSLQTLTPEELLSLSVQVLSKDDKETSIQLLRLALEKDPGYVRGLVLMGQALLQKTELSEATKYLELAISKLLDEDPSDAEDVELLMLASQWAGAAYVQQGKMKSGITHLERVAKLKEPGDPKSKEHYFEALLLLSSALYKEGQSDEAAKILRVVVDHNPAYKPLLEQCEDENELVSDLVSRRKDHF